MTDTIYSIKGPPSSNAHLKMDALFCNARHNKYASLTNQEKSIAKKKLQLALEIGERLIQVKSRPDGRSATGHATWGGMGFVDWMKHAGIPSRSGQYYMRVYREWRSNANGSRNISDNEKMSDYVDTHASRKRKQEEERQDREPGTNAVPFTTRKPKETDKRNLAVQARKTPQSMGDDAIDKISQILPALSASLCALEAAIAEGYELSQHAETVVCYNSTIDVLTRIYKVCGLNPGGKQRCYQ